MADRFYAGIAKLVMQLGEHDPATSLDDVSDRDLHVQAAEAIGAGVGWSSRDLPYPGFEAPAGNVRAKPPRCSVVLAPRHVQGPDDAPGLFSDSMCAPEEACWIEFVLAREWRHVERCPRYAPAFTDRAMRLVAQLATDERIVHARLAWLVLASSEERARTDLATWERLALSEGLPIGAPVIRAQPIPDVQGNAACLTAIVPVQRL
jgi:hypothetical protein